MKYVIRKRCAQRITTFYRNVSKKYRHTYFLELMEKNVNDAYDAIYQIEQTLQRRLPTIARWKGYDMANTEKWYYAYRIDGETITVVDAVCSHRHVIPLRLRSLIPNIRQAAMSEYFKY